MTTTSYQRIHLLNPLKVLIHLNQPTHQMMMIVIQADNILTALIPIRTAILLDLNMKFYREKWMSRLGISAISEKLYGPVSLTAA